MIHTGPVRIHHHYTLTEVDASSLPAKWDPCLSVPRLRETQGNILTSGAPPPRPTCPRARLARRLARESISRGHAINTPAKPSEPLLSPALPQPSLLPNPAGERRWWEAWAAVSRISQTATSA
jgi:hypothetical protein